MWIRTILSLAVFSPMALFAAEPAPLKLFDGETSFGWKITGDSKIADGTMILGPKATTAELTTTLPAGEVLLAYTLRDGKASVLGNELPGNKTNIIKIPVKGSRVIFTVDVGEMVISKLNYIPSTGTSLFNGKDLTGWKVFPDRKSKFTVTPEGWLNVQDGPGDLQTTEQYADFLFQTECISNGKWLNSGIFFRGIPNQYQQGYEAQIRNQWVGTDRKVPFDFGTGAIYRRQPARKVVSTDNEWFTLTLIAEGNHMATWVNGIQVTDFTDDRPAKDNGRQGSKTSAGVLSIQGHDPTTNLSFRNMRVVPFPAK